MNLEQTIANISHAKYTVNKFGYRGEIKVDYPLTKRTLMKLLVGKSITFFKLNSLLIF